MPSITKVLDHGSVELVDSMASDEMVLRAMLVSTGKDNDEIFTTLTDYPDLPYSDKILDDRQKVVIRNTGRINYLMREKHGTPFEHNSFVFRITAPIFVLREWHRHRIGWSYNEQSGRYMELGDKWYIPSEVRTRVGKPGHYTYEPINDEIAERFKKELNDICRLSHFNYGIALRGGIAPEQARLFLHVNHYSSMYATCNARSLMHFLALRNASTAQQEIKAYAVVLESLFADLMPVTWHAFVNNGRVAP